MEQPTPNSIEFIVDEKHLTQMVMGYLRERGHYEALSCLQLECGFGEGEMGDELQYLQRLILQGSWQDVIVYLQPLRRVLIQNYSALECMIKKQQVFAPLPSPIIHPNPSLTLFSTL